MSWQVKFYYKLSSGDKIFSSVIGKERCARNFSDNFWHANEQLLCANKISFVVIPSYLELP